MKSLFLTSTLLLFSVAVFASNPNKGVKDVIKSELKKTDFMGKFKANGEIVVAFKVNSQGKIVVEDSNSNDDELQTRLVAFLNSIQLKEVNIDQQEFKMRFVFRQY